MLTPDTARVVDLAGATPERILVEMDEYAREREFPTVGPAVGRLLRLLARSVGATRVFEFGSGFGYSAAWFAGALPPEGEVVLTDYDAENIDRAREFLERGGYDDRARYEVGDAVETFQRESGAFDVILLDNQKAAYVETFELARERLRDGGLVVADNMLAGPFGPAEVRAALEGASIDDERATGVARYLERVRDDPAFETSVVPLGEGVAISRAE